MKCNACSRFLLCDKKTCNFKRIRDVKIKKLEGIKNEGFRRKKEIYK